MKDDLLQILLDNQLEDLSGARIQGQICLQDSFVNALLQPLTLPAPFAATQKTGTAATSPINPASLLPLLKIHTLHYETTHNKTMITIDLVVAER